MPKMKISKLMFYSTVLTSVMLSSCSQHAKPTQQLKIQRVIMLKMRQRIGLNSHFAVDATKLTYHLTV